MTRISNILVPVDFSKASQKAMDHATHLALKFGARLTAAHIIPSFTAFNYAFPGDTDDFEKKAFVEARRLLPKEIPASCRDRLDTQTIVKCGDVRDELLGIIAEEGADLVVMGTHGRRSLQRFFLGSTTESVLRRVPVPILTVSEYGADWDIESPFEVPFRKILYATDLSEGEPGLHYCVDLARTLGAHLTLLHVMEFREPAFEDVSEIHARRMGELHKAAEREHSGNVVTEVLRGAPHHEILKYAETMNADLIVINLQSKGLLERALLGSAAERVIRSAKIPVLSIPNPIAPAMTAVRTAESSICSVL
jgi:nucleotide-binding universal stress UspA family protein